MKIVMLALLSLFTFCNTFAEPTGDIAETTDARADSPDEDFLYFLLLWDGKTQQGNLKNSTENMELLDSILDRANMPEEVTDNEK